ncbi:MAG: hypothetical protein K2Q25_09880 [Mycobacteriaceae bacterium]|nr:hypothetical protein [Mycobacteriaceae bacterium]
MSLSELTGLVDYAVTVTDRAPAAVRGAGFIVAAQGVLGLGTAGALLLRRFDGAEQRVVDGLGTGIWFLLFGSAVFAAGCALLRGRRWGRGLAVFIQLLLLPVAWYLAVGSQRLVFGIALGVIALGTVVLLFSPAALRWVGRQS